MNFLRFMLHRLFINELKQNKVEINSKWYIAKPLVKKSFLQRYRDAINVLFGGGNCSSISLF